MMGWGASRGKKESSTNFAVVLVVDLVEDKGFVVVVLELVFVEVVELIVVESVFRFVQQFVVFVPFYLSFFVSLIKR
jgi:hypothetical protein